MLDCILIFDLCLNKMDDLLIQGGYNFYDS